MIPDKTKKTPNIADKKDTTERALCVFLFLKAILFVCINFSLHLFLHVRLFSTQNVHCKQIPLPQILHIPIALLLLW